MSHYVDGFVIPIRKSRVGEYRKMANLGCKLWMEYGALAYYETIGDDYPKWGVTFPKLCKLKTGETVIFAFIIFKSKAHRNSVNAKVMKDPRMNMEGMKMPFDMKRFAVAGCKTLVSASRQVA
jgi:uncharacterized protein YbaA (DUF1428 family)